MNELMPNKEAGRPLREVTQLKDIFSNEEFLGRLRQAVPKQMSPNRMLRTLIGSVQKSPNLLRCSLLDVAGKMLVLAQAGLEADTPLGHAHLIPFKSRRKNRQTDKWEDHYVCQVVFGYHGLLDLSYRTGMVGAVTAKQVWADEIKAGRFSFEYGTDRHLKYIPSGAAHNVSEAAQRDGTAEDPVWVFAHATLKDNLGDPFEVMPWADVIHIRNRTPAFRAARAALDEALGKGWDIPKAWTEAPWVAWRGPMACKTAFRQLSNWMPRSIEMASAISLDAAQENEEIDLGPVIDGTVFNPSADPGEGPDYMSEGNNVAGTSGDPGATFGVRDQDDPGATGSGTADASTSPASGGTGQSPSQPDVTGTTGGAAPVSQAGKAPQTAPSDRPSDQPSGTARAAQPTRHQEFEAYLLDDAGEVSGDASYIDPVTFMNAYAALWKASGNRVGLAEQNADGLQDARLASGDAAEIMDGLQDDAVMVIAAPHAREGWGGYLKAFAAELKAVPLDRKQDWIAAQMPVVKTASAKTRAMILKTVQSDAAALDLTVTPAMAAMIVGETSAPPADPQDGQHAPADPGQDADKDRVQCSRLIVQLQANPDRASAESFMESPLVTAPMDRWKRSGRGDLVLSITNAFDAFKRNHP